MNYIRHFVVGLLVFAVVIGIFVDFNNEINENYNLEDNFTKTLNLRNETVNGNIGQHLNKLLIIDATNTISEGITKLTPGAGDLRDILGGLASVGIGALKTISGVFIFPFQIVDIFVSFYAGEVSGKILATLVMIFSVYGVFILLSAHLNRKI